MAFTGSILVMASPHISQKVNPARLVIPHQRKHSFGDRGFHLEKKILHTKGFGSITVRATSAAVEQEDVLEVAKKEKRRFLRLVYRVTDLERSIKYYTECFRMKLYERKDDKNSSRAILGFGPQKKHFVVEIFSTDLLGEFDIGTGFGHFGISAHDVFSYVEYIKANGGTITGGPTDTGVTYNAFAKDPDGYLFELVQRPSIFDLRLSHVNLGVADLNRSISFYEDALGMKKLEEVHVTEGPIQFSLGIMAYAHDYYTKPNVELTHYPNQTEYTKGNAFSHFAIGTNDVDNCAKAVSRATQKLGVNTTPAPPPGLNIPTTELLFVDPDGWKIVFYDNAEIPVEGGAIQ